MTKRFGRPIQRATSEHRTYEGRIYASKAEMLYAEYLDALVKLGEVFRWLPQPLFHLTPDISFRPDFIVTGHTPDVQDPSQVFEDTYAVDVKGYAQVGWTKKRKLWLKYAPIKLLVVERKKHSFQTIEIVDPSIVNPRSNKCS